MQGRKRTLRLSFWAPRALLVLGAAFGIHAVMACQGSALAGPDVTACTPAAPCPCEEDPNQSKCKGFNDRGDTGVITPVESGTPDANEAGVPVEAGDDGGDSSDDGGDDAGD